MTILWRILAISVLLGSSSGYTSAGPAASVLVVYVSGVRPIEDAVAGLRVGLGRSAVFVDLKHTTGGDWSTGMGITTPALIVAVGMEALSTVAAQVRQTPILAAAVLHSDAAPFIDGPSGRRAAVLLDLPPDVVAVRLSALFPGRNRLGLLRNPARPDPEGPPSLAKLRQMGFTAEVRECGRPEELLKSFDSLKRSADFVLLQPDGALYNEATVRPLVMASVDRRLPIIGFSASFVRAGAALGAYPDYTDIGEQTAEAARRFLATKGTLANQVPRKITVALNEPVLRLMGLKASPRAQAEAVVIQ